MSGYGWVLSLHVIVAILGVGQLAAVAVTAGKADVATLTSLIRNARLSLAAMFISGAALDFMSGGAFHERLWFRGSAILLIVTGILSWRAQKAARAAQPARVRGLSWGMCGAVALITILMELKPW